MKKIFLILLFYSYILETNDSVNFSNIKLTDLFKGYTQESINKFILCYFNAKDDSHKKVVCSINLENKNSKNKIDIKNFDNKSILDN